MNDFEPFKFSIAEVTSETSSVPEKDWRLLRRLEIPDHFNNPRGGVLKRGLVIDVEASDSHDPFFGSYVGFLRNG